MNLISKLRETLSSVLPILAIVFILNLTIAPIGWELMIKFLLGGGLIILGLSVFLLGTDIGILPVGQRVGAALVHKRRLGLMLAVGFVVGFFITVAEPDVRVLALQAAKVDSSMSMAALVLMIGIGVGLFVAIGFGRTILGLSYRNLLLGSYALVFLLAYFTEPAYLGVAFDAGGATTGPMTVPFIMALGVGVAEVRRKSEDDSFGMVGLASIGPIMAVLITGILAKGRASGTALAEANSLESLGIADAFLHLIPETLLDVAKALGPLALMFLAFQLALLHMPRHQLARTAKGLLYAFLGLVLFFVGVNGGFLPAGREIGGLIASSEHKLWLIPIGLLLGAMVVLAEPAIWVLTNQVEEVSGGYIKKQTMLVALSLGVAVAVGLAMVRVLSGLSIWWLIVPGYALALALSQWAPPLFTAIAFDSGGVASGPMSSTFILAFTLGASAAVGGNPITDAFGVIAMIAMTPLIAIQLLGLVYARQEKRAASPAVESPSKEEAS